MKASRDYLEEALSKLGDCSDAEKARQMKFSPQAMSFYRSGERKMDDFACIMVARVLGLDPMEIIAACQEEREKSEERREFWKDFRKTLGVQVVASLTLGAMTMTAAPEAKASNNNPLKPPMTNVYYV